MPSMPDSHAVNRTAADQLRPVPAKVTGPFMAVEKPRALVGLYSDTGEARAFVVIVGEAGKGKIFSEGFAAVLFRDDVIDFEGQFVVSDAVFRSDLTATRALC